MKRSDLKNAASWVPVYRLYFVLCSQSYDLRVLDINSLAIARFKMISATVARE